MNEYWNAMVPELSVTNLEKSLKFYLAVGFSVKFQRDDPPFAYIERGEAQIMLEQIHGDGWVTGELERPFGRGVNFQIEIECVAETQNSALKADLPLFEESKERWYATDPRKEEGQIEFLLQDPDGYLIRFIEPLGERDVDA